jgi:predicted nucleotidyltransferase
MDQKLVVARLREHAPELQAAGLMHVRVFGSTARDENSGDSDVDLLVEFDPARQQTLVSVGSLQSRLSDIPASKAHRRDRPLNPIFSRTQHQSEGGPMIP